MKRLTLSLTMATLLTACALQAPPTRPVMQPQQAAPRTLTIMTHDSFSASEDVIAEFERTNNAKVVILKSGDAGSTLNKAILSKDAPLADVIYGVDNTFLGRALAADIVEPYNSPALADIPDRFKLDPQNRMLPVDYGHVIINYDKAYLQEKGLAPPTSLRELTEPQWKGKLVVQNPATSSPGLAFLLATIAAFPEGSAYDWKQFWRDLRANDVYVSPDWSDAYYAQFSGSSGKGPRPLVVSYATSPAAEVFFSEGKLEEPPTGNLEGTAFEQIEFVGILKGAKNRDLAEKWVDFMLSRRFQEDIPLQMFVYPVAQTAKWPEVFVKFGQPPAQAFSLTPEQIDQGRDQWIETWTQLVLK
ncbi:MAG: thiamine ABC transporter substrate-binding protein [Candidatus Thermofonsia Clade 3 bacterium]|uniref:Thiamine ABC transporter substrate-binding protein n=1 Tax=Candidatus Thermofonsia Clade 3 bacterium TaxID=2364212 RepID=A0A2M8QD34_9CHLR|nr:thiamine ABC transporter substrate-binding protein [Candidatus Roseilinea sp. NK_OTU-006]PJF47725.1 MAG: thiamine ABC transporter substrate-binding protein [Candidatus Thermofonsia Clade 3 bacterium]